MSNCYRLGTKKNQTHNFTNMIKYLIAKHAVQMMLTSYASASSALAREDKQQQNYNYNA